MRDIPVPRAALVLALALCSVGVTTTDAEAQGVRGWIGTTVQAVELRPLGDATGGCVQNAACYLPLAEETAVVGTQDLSLTAWGFGVQGLSGTVYLRGRGGLGSRAVWPRSEDHFDAIMAYAQYMRGPWTIRAGRQDVRSGLGFASFDGGTVAWRKRRLQVEAYGGRSLARGLRDPANEALRGIEDFVPDQSIYLFGGAARARYSTGSAALRYQRELLSDRSGLASERASVDASAALPSVRITGGIDYDFGLARLGKGHVTATAPVGGGRWMLSASARRYVPYFSLSTIWGFFEPVAYHEVQGRVGWSRSSTFGLWASGGWRKYGDAQATEVLRALEDTGWRAEAGALWSLSDAWTVDGGYHIEWGPGAFLQSADGAVRWAAASRLSLSVSATTFQQIEQYRLGDGRAYGGGVSFDGSVTDRLSLSGGLSMLRHSQAGNATDSPWNQSRGWSTLRLAVGRDPGLANRVSR